MPLAPGSRGPERSPGPSVRERRCGRARDGGQWGPRSHPHMRDAGPSAGGGRGDLGEPPDTRMNRIDALFARLRSEDRRALMPFVTAGDPDLATTAALIREALARGSHLVEIGIPY